MENTTGLRAPEIGNVAQWVQAYCGLHLPATAMCPGHCSPADYVEHAFGEGPENGDCVVWACRGGGKTQLGAVVTLLDLLFKPGIQVRILGGSLDQSSRMYGHLRRLMRRRGFRDELQGNITGRGFLLKNGSKVEILAQSQSAVRGQRVQKLRCDEVELFKPEVWEAAQLTTRSLGINEMLDAQVTEKEDDEDTERAAGLPMEDIRVRGRVEAISTMHQPGGLMQRLVEQSPLLGRRVFAWCVWDAVEHCPPARPCAACPLWDECQGRAKQADGFMRIDDLIAMKRRVSAGVWEREMLCLPPRFDDAVFAAFTRAQHARAFDVQDGDRIEGHEVEWYCGVDFGFAGAFVCLWLAVERDPGASGESRVWVCDELVAQRLTLEACARQMTQRAPGADRIKNVGCDSAGNATNSHTAMTDMAVLRRKGYTVQGRTHAIENGIEYVRMLLKSADGNVRLTIHPRCPRLLAALEGYRISPATGKAVKDGVHDHLIDALRYGLAGAMGTGAINRHY